MPTVVFDFDSTVITIESLEFILHDLLAGYPEREAALAAITREGMNGTIPFSQSLHQRLAIAAPSLAAVRRFGDMATKWLTPGIENVFHDLLSHGIQVHIASGGLFEAIVPLALKLNIPAARVHAVRLGWDEQGRYLGLDPQDLFAQSKLAGLQRIMPQWPQPVIAIGDGMTDFALYEAGLAKHFVAFTQHARRPSLQRLIESGHILEANSSAALATLLETWL